MWKKVVLLGISPGLLLRMQTDHNLQVVKKDSKLRKRLTKIREIAVIF